MLAMAGLPAPGGARTHGKQANRHLSCSPFLSLCAEAAELEAMGVEEAYEEEDAVDVDAMSYEVRRQTHVRTRKGPPSRFASALTRA